MRALLLLAASLSAFPWVCAPAQAEPCTQTYRLTSELLDDPPCDLAGMWAITDGRLGRLIDDSLALDKSTAKHEAELENIATVHKAIVDDLNKQIAEERGSTALCHKQGTACEADLLEASTIDDGWAWPEYLIGVATGIGVAAIVYFAVDSAR